MRLKDLAKEALAQKSRKKFDEKMDEFTLLICRDPKARKEYLRFVKKIGKALG